MWFGTGVATGITTLTFALGSVPSRLSSRKVTDDTLIYSGLSEIRVPRASELSISEGIDRLDAQRSRYREDLPHIKSAAARISTTKYRSKVSSRK